MAVLVVTLVGAVLGVSDTARREAVEAITWLVSFLIGGHAVTDVGHQVATAVRDRPHVKLVAEPAVPPAPAPPPPPSDASIGTDQTERVTPVETPSGRVRLPRPPGGWLPGSKGGLR